MYGRRSEQIARPQTVDELPPREDGDTVDFAGTGFVCDEDTVAERAFVADGTKWMPKSIANRQQSRRFCSLIARSVGDFRGDSKIGHIEACAFLHRWQRSSFLQNIVLARVNVSIELVWRSLWMRRRRRVGTPRPTDVVCWQYNGHDNNKSQLPQPICSVGTCEISKQLRFFKEFSGTACL